MTAHKHCKYCEDDHPATLEFWAPNELGTLVACRQKVRDRARAWARANPERAKAARQAGYARRKPLYNERKRRTSRTPAARFAKLRATARRRGWVMELTRAEFDDLQAQPCHYCGGPLALETGYGLDRVDSERGYIAANVVPCCGVCNQAKMDLPVAAFRAWLLRVHAHWGSRDV